MSKNKLLKITFFDLIKIFPKDTLWISSRADLIGYSKYLNKHYVIEDGICVKDYNRYTLHIYSPSNPKEHEQNWYNDPDYNCPRKYIDDKKLFEHGFPFKLNNNPKVVIIENLVNKFNIMSSKNLFKYKTVQIDNEYLEDLFNILPGLKYLKENELLDIIAYQVYFTQLLLK